MTTTASTDEVTVAAQRLADALTDLQPARTPCQDSGTAVMYFDEHRDVRQAAAEACAVCPVLELCARYADAAGERWGVWGGTDRETTTSRRRRGAAT